MYDVRFDSPATYLIAGPSSSGKTHLLYRLMKFSHVISKRTPKQ